MATTDADADADDTTVLDLESWVTVRDASAEIGCSTQHLYLLINSKRLDPPARYFPEVRKILIPRKTVDVLVESFGQKTEPGSGGD